MTTGAADDFRKVTQMAYQSITQYGFGKAAGWLSYPTADQEQSAQYTRPYSDAIAQAIDEEVRVMVNDMYERTKALLKEKKRRCRDSGKVVTREGICVAHGREAETHLLHYRREQAGD